MDTETRIRARSDGLVEYRMIPAVARELSVLLYEVGAPTNDGGWLQDARALDEAATEAEEHDA